MYERQTGLDTQQLKTNENGVLKWGENKANTGSRWVEFLHMTSKNVNKNHMLHNTSLTLGVCAFLQRPLRKVFTLCEKQVNKNN